MAMKLNLKEKYQEMINKMDGDEELLEFLIGRMSLLSEYVQKVYSMETLQPILYAKFEGDELRDAIMNLDRQRRYAHEAAIDAVKQINRICKSLDLPDFYTGDTEDRYEVADFCEQIVVEFFDGRKR